MKSTFKKLWKQYIEWLDANEEDLVDEVAPAATKAEIDTLAASLGVELPEDFIAYLSCHNGQLPDSEGIFEYEELLGTSRILSEWKIWKQLVDNGDFDGMHSQPDDGIKNDWFNVKWIPLTYDGGGNHYCLDLDPAEGGKVGQIIRMWHDSADRELIASSLEEWLTDALERWEYDGWG